MPVRPARLAERWILLYAISHNLSSDTPSISSDVDTAQAQKNTFFQNFMNNRLGFNLQTWQYMQFQGQLCRSRGRYGDHQQLSADDDRAFV